MGVHPFNPNRLASDRQVVASAVITLRNYYTAGWVRSDSC